MLEIDARSQAGEEVGDEALALLNQILLWPIALFFLSIVLSIWYGVVEFRYLTNGVHLKNVGLRSEISAPFVYRVYSVFRVAFLILGGLMAGLIALLVGAISAIAQNTGLAQILPIGLLITFFLFYGILRTLLVDVTLLKRACATMSVANPQELDSVIQSSADLPSHGEGLADALDVGGF